MEPLWLILNVHIEPKLCWNITLQTCKVCIFSRIDLSNTVCFSKKIFLWLLLNSITFPSYFTSSSKIYPLHKNKLELST